MSSSKAKDVDDDETGGCILYATQEFSKTATNSNNNVQQTAPNATSKSCRQRRSRRSGSGHCNKSNKNKNEQKQKQNRSDNKHAWPLSTSSAFTFTFTSAIASAFPASKSFHSVFEKNHTISSHKQLLTFLLFTMTLVVLLQQQQITAKPLQSGNRAAVASPPAAAAAAAAVAAELISASLPTELHTRLRKRHSSWRELYAREMNSHEMEWTNPCGGEWHQNDSAEQRVSPSHRTPVKKILRILQNSTGKEQKTIKFNAPVINISDISMWSLHKETYKFLPVLKLNSNVALRRWHRQMQLYVASFAYLRRAQLVWDHSKLQHESAISKELLKLKQSSRSILCEIEIAINTTSPSDVQRSAHAASHQRVTHHKRQNQRLSFLSRAAMEKRLRFLTNIREVYRTTDVLFSDDEHLLQEVHSIDLKFTKYRYFGYLRAMLKILRSHTRRLTAIRTTTATTTPFISQENNRAQMELERRSKSMSTHKGNSIKNGRRKRSRKSKIQNQKKKNREAEREREGVTQAAAVRSNHSP